MVAQFQSILSPFIIIFTVPLAFTGGMIGLMIFGQSISALSLIHIYVESNNIAVVAHDNDKKATNVNYAYELKNSNLILKYVDDNNKENTIELTYSEKDKQPSVIDGTWNDAAGNEYIFCLLYTSRCV